MSVGYDDVVASFEMVLGRAPDSEEAVNYHLRLGFRDRLELGAYMCGTGEFRARFDRMLAEGRIAGTSAPQPEQPQAVRQRPIVYLGDRVLTETHRGFKIYVPPGDMDLGPHIMLNGIWETHVETALLRLLRPGMQAIDIGANIGYHALTLAGAVGATGRVHAFEANPPLSRMLEATVFINGMTGWTTVHNLAVMDRVGTITLASQPGHFGSGNVVPPGAQAAYHADYSTQVEVPGVALDTLLGEAAPVDLIRIDIEGSEPQALRGAAAVIARSQGLRIVAEWSVPMMAARADVGGFVAWLEGMGFRFWLINSAGGFEPLAAGAMLGLPHSDVLISRQDPD